MNLRIKATKIDLTPNLKDYIEKKMGMLKKYLGGVQILNFDFEVELITRHHNKGEIYRAEANLELPGRLLRVEKTEKELFKAIDKVKDHLADAVRHYKEKLIAQKRPA